MYVKVPLGVITWLSYFTLHFSQKYWLFIHFPSCSHQVNCTHWTKWYFTDFPYLLLANQWRPKIWEDYGDDTSTYFLKSTFPFWKNVHNWLCHLFPSWTLPCIALCKRARLKLEDAKIGPDLPIILTDTRGIANTFSTPWIWIHGTWNVNETINDGCIAHWETSKTLGPLYDQIRYF